MFTLPNIITMLNAFGGCLALVSIFSGQLSYLPWILGGCLVADFSDGLVARLLKASSPIGKELDSLADVISFGAVPGAIFYYLLSKNLGIAGFEFGNPESYWTALGFVITAFSALRLAKFNLDTRQSENFIGLNTPANTIFSLGLLLTVEANSFGLQAFIVQMPVLLGLIALLSFLLIAELPILGFKFKKFTWKGNEARFVFLIIAPLFLAFLPFGLALMLLIFLYIALSVVLWALGKLSLNGAA